ncbi:MAG: STAS domain-containing protein, partial [Anaerolineae bacterium]|nr:STAS domain-containing protein [Anaerolineae bacterium]
MLDRLNAIVRPRATDEKSARREFLLGVAALVLGMVSGVSIIVSGVLLLIGVTAAVVTLIVGVLTALTSAGAFWLSRRGHLQAAAGLLPLVIWGTATVLLAAGGWYTPLVVGYALCVMLATLLGGPINGLAFWALSVIAYWGIGTQQFAGLLPTLFLSPDRSLGTGVFILSASLIVISLLLYALDRQLERLSARRLSEMRLYADELETIAREREELVHRLQRTTHDQERLLQAIRAISAPVLPLFEGLIVMPIVGELDPARSNLLLDDMLDGIARYKADSVLLDVTGVPALDATSARGLLQAVQGAQMLGCECRLVG